VTLRQFAGLWLLAFAGLACWQGFARGHAAAAAVLAALAVAVGVPGLVWPRAVRPVFVGGMVLAFPVGWAVAQVTMAFLFYGLLTPLGLVFALAGRDALGLRRRPGRETYWAPKPAAADVGRYYRPY
jgi:hypothetical protein